MTDQIFRSGSRFAKVVTWLFIVGIVTNLLSIGSDLADIELMQRLEGGDWTEAEVEANDMRSGVIAILNAFVILIGMIAFLVWIHRVRANLPALGIADARWGPGWAIGWWFIPIMNLFRLFQMVKEIWQASGPEAQLDAWRDTAAPALLGWWWAAWLIASAAGNVAFRVETISPETIDGLIRGSMAYIASEALWAIASIPAIMVVRRIDRRQAGRHATLFAEVFK